MPLDNATYISQLNDGNPTVGDPVSEGDDHMRNMKFVLKGTFPGAANNGFAKPIVATEDELNNLTGLNEPLADFINSTVEGSTNTVDTQQIVDGAVTAAKLDITSMQQAGIAPSAWVVFNGDVSLSTPANIISSLNVASVEQETTSGHYTITFNTPMANADYVIQMSAQKKSTASDNNIITMLSKSVTPTVAGFRMVAEYDLNGTFTGVKSPRVSVLIFGGLA